MNMQNVTNLEITEGEVRTIHDSSDNLLWGRLNYDTKYEGDTYQQTYSGKNLFDFSTVIMGDASGSFNTIRASSRQVYFLKAGTYTFSTNNSDPYNYAITTYNTAPPYSSYPTWTFDSLWQSSHSYTFTTTQDGYMTISFRKGNNESFTLSELQPFNYQLESGSTASDFEPYVGGTASPNPDYPQDIQVVTGEQTVNVHGKNLLNVSTMEQGNFSYINNYESANNSIIRSGFFACEPNTKYTLSLNEEIGEIGVIYKDSGGNLIQGFGNNSTNKYFTFTTKADAVQMRIRVGSGSYPKTIGVDYKLMVEQSDSPTTYEPYQSQDYTIDLGSIELCKIGTYQDKIFQNVPESDLYNSSLDEGDWYVHKETGKVVLKGNEIIESLSFGTNTYGVSLSNLGGDESDINVISDCFYGISFSNRVTSQQFIVYRDGDRIDIRNTTWSTDTEFKTWLAANKPVVYHKLANYAIADIKITDSTLISQLNAIHEWLTRYGYTPTVSGNLPLIINQTNLT